MALVERLREAASDLLKPVGNDLGEAAPHVEEIQPPTFERNITRSLNGYQTQLFEASSMMTRHLAAIPESHNMEQLLPIFNGQVRLKQPSTLKDTHINEYFIRN